MALDSYVQQLLQQKLDLQSGAADLHNKRIIYRVDLNCPLTKDNAHVSDDNRLRAILPTLQLLLQRGGRVILCSHLGRPEPDSQSLEEMQQQFSLAPVAALLKQQLGDAFTGLVPDCIGSQAEAAAEALQPGQACLLENLRFHKGEAANDPGFAQQLAQLGEVYVNDAFGVVHRDQASITGILDHMSCCYPGLLLHNELTHLVKVCNHPERPFGVVIGGAKVKDKIKVLHSLIHKADVLLIGGRMAFTFLAAEGVAVGRTQIEEDWLEPCREMRQLARERGVQLLLPQDAVVARSLNDDCGCCTVPLTTTCCSSDSPCVPEGCYGLDIGPKSSAAFAEAITGCKTVFWNGPMGRFEVPGFAAATQEIARAMGRATEAGATTVVGGGDSVSAVNHMQPVPAMSFVSTGGGASLELIREQLLPGIKALADAAAKNGQLAS